MRKFIYSLIVSLISFSLLGGVGVVENNPQYPPTRKKFTTPVGFNYKKLHKKHKRVRFWRRGSCSGAM